MKLIAYCIIVSFCILTSGCVRRTVSVSKMKSRSDGTGLEGGRKPQSEVVEEKTIWIWQDEFRNR